MIHSMAGGRLGSYKTADIAKEKIIEGENEGAVTFYTCSHLNLLEGDVVLVSYGGANVEAKVLRIDKNVSSDRSPVPMARAKRIISKL